MKKTTKAASGQNSSKATPGEQTADLKKFGKAINSGQNDKDVQAKTPRNGTSTSKNTKATDKQALDKDPKKKHNFNQVDQSTKKVPPKTPNTTQKGVTKATDNKKLIIDTKNPNLTPPSDNSPLLSKDYMSGTGLQEVINEVDEKVEDGYHIDSVLNQQLARDRGRTVKQVGSTFSDEGQEKKTGQNIAHMKKLSDPISEPIGDKTTEISVIDQMQHNRGKSVENFDKISKIPTINKSKGVPEKKTGSGSISPMMGKQGKSLSKSNLASQESFPSSGGGGGQQSSIEIERLKSQLMIQKQKLNQLNETTEQLRQAKEKARDAEDKAYQLTDQNAQLDTEIQELKDEIKELNQENDQLRSKNDQQQRKLEDTQQECQNIKSESRNLQSRVNSLETTISSLNGKIATLDEEIQQFDKAEEAAKDDSKEWENKLIELQEKNSKAQNMIRNANGKIQQLVTQIQEMEKKFPLYVSKKNDKIDLALANVINQFPERQKMKVMFLRESEGIYQFGQKRVYIKIEQGDQPYVRIGGGYMHAKEFIDYYTTNEVEKIERKNVIQQFQQKLKMQRVAQYQSVNSVERVPVDRSQSPSKLRDGSPNMYIRGDKSNSRASRNRTASKEAFSQEISLRQVKSANPNNKSGASTRGRSRSKKNSGMNIQNNNWQE